MTVVDVDALHDARHELDQSPDARESLAFVVSAPQERLGLIIYTWVGGDGTAGSLLLAFGDGLDEPVIEAVDGLDVPDDMGFDDWRVGPIGVRHAEPLRTAEITFAGERLSLTCRFEATTPAYNYGAHADGCPWFLARDRYEQSCLATGTVTVDGRAIEFRAGAHRDHSWGTRNWGAPQHWKWINIQSCGRPSNDVGIHVMEVFALGRRQLFGYVVKDGEAAEVTALADVSYAFDDQLFHRRFCARIVDDLGRDTAVDVSAHGAYELKISPVLTLNEVSLSGTVDGADATAHVEMAWAPDYLERARADAGVRAHPTVGATP